MESVNKARELPRCPRESVGLISYVTFAWVSKIFFKGNSKTLSENDLYQPLKEQKADNLGSNLETETDKGFTLYKSLLHVFGFQLFRQGLILLFLECGVKILPPIFLSRIIIFYSNTNEGSSITVAWLSVGIILAILFNVLILHAFNVTNLNLGFMIKTGVSSLIYRKCLTLSKTYIGAVSTGKIVNMMSTDVGKFEAVVLWMHYLWVGPIQTILVTTLMYQEIGVSALSGVIILILFLPLQREFRTVEEILHKEKYKKIFMNLVFAKISRCSPRVNKYGSSDRNKGSIIQGIQVIKMYAWEMPFSKVVSTVRFNETKLIRNYSWIRGILLSFIIFAAPVSVFTSLVMYALLGNAVTAQKVFVVIAFFNVLKHTMIVMYPFAINFVIDCWTSIMRISDFLENANSFKVTKISNSNNSTEVKMENVSADWGNDSKELTLSNFNFHFENLMKIAVIGKVGAGKSSLIQSILGELPIKSGNIYVNGIISYASQDPWLFSGSLRQNILFGEALDIKRYKSVIEACSLGRDIELWPNGDSTVVGERGTSLSGGQKARINLARAIYRKADIYLLDDPLSAVDSLVGQHIFDNCIKKFLKDKLVILVTHQLQYLSSVDRILILEHGRVEGSGTLECLIESGLNFAKLLPHQDDKANDKTSKTSSLNTSESSITKEEDAQDSLPTKRKELHQHKRDVPVEKRAEGSIDLKCYKSYFTAAGSYYATVIITILFTLSQIFTSVGDYFVSYWVRKEEERSATLDYKIVTNDSPQDIVYDRQYDIIIFSVLTIGTVVITLSRSFVFFNVTMRASRQLHDAMFAAVTRATMYFFNTNPSGRILNRFSKDVGQIDETLPFILIDVFQIMFGAIGALGVLAVVNPIYLIPTVILFSVFYYLRKFYLKTSLDVKRIHSTTRSPIFSYLTETLHGLSTIRALGAEKVLVKEFDSHQDLHTSAFYILLVTARAFGFWLDICCVCYVAIVVLSFFLMATSGANVGLAITQAMGLTGMVQLGIKQTAALENSMTSVERIVEYNTIDSESAFKSPAEKKPPKSWPNRGEIKFEKLSMSYIPNSPQTKVLKELSFHIFSQERIGIVGRTGAGKSSIINALLRLSYTDGHIFIDNENTQLISLHDLRSKISIIPQDPVLFSGTMRYNLDPFDEFSDEKLWSALSEVKLIELISKFPAQLNTNISEGGANFSVGQRQLVCLARAILRANKILVLDEATANVDLETDALIQETIRLKFRKCTVLTIAHRLNTVMDSDRILVIDAGRVVEFAAPFELLTRTSRSTFFYNMVKKAGQSNFDILQKSAEEHYFKRKME